MTTFTRRHWRSPAFVLVFVTLSVVWLMVVGWVTWFLFNPVTDWIGRQNDVLQEACSLAALLPWALFLAGGIGAAAHIAERAAGIRPIYEPGQSSGQHAKWRRPPKT
jgi:hypothetical protein